MLWDAGGAYLLDHEDAFVTRNILILIITRLPLSSSYAMTVPAITLLIVFCIFLEAENVEITLFLPCNLTKTGKWLKHGDDLS